MTKRLRDTMVGISAVMVAGLSVYFGFAGRSHKVDLGTYEVLGTVTGEETAQLIGGKGEVLVVTRDTGSDKNPAVEAEVQALAQVLKKNSGLKVTREPVELTPVAMMATGGAIPAEALLHALEKHPNVQAVVLFFAFPALADGQRAELQKRSLKTVVVSALHPDYPRLLDEQVFHLAIVPRPESLSTGVPPRTTRERFDQEFIVLKAAAPAAKP